MAVSWQMVRTRVLPIVFFGILGLVGLRTCGAENAEAEVTYQFGDATQGLRSLRVDYFRGDEPVSYLERTFREGESVRSIHHSFRAKVGTYTARVRIHTAQGSRTVERVILLESGARITVNLADDGPQ